MIYFACHPRGKKDKVQVIDLDHSVDYEIDEWARPDDLTFDSPEAAITHCRNLAKKNNLEYIPFTSRYDSDLDENESAVYYADSDYEQNYMLEDLVSKPREAVYEQLIKDIKDGTIDDVGHLRLRLFLILKGDI